MRHHDDRFHDGWTRRAPGRLRAATGLAGGAALCVEAHGLRGPVVAFAAALAAATIVVATLRHADVVRWSDRNGVLANLAVVPPAFVGYACAFRTMSLPVAALLALATGLVLAWAWLVVVAPRRAARAATPARSAPAERAAVPREVPVRLWARASAARDDA